MSRPRLTTEELSSRYQDIKETLDYLKDKRSNATTDAQKNELTKKIALVKKNLHGFKERYKDRLSPEIKKEEHKQNTITTFQFNKTPLITKLQQIREKAQQLIKNASTEEEKQSIKERLQAVELRYKYSF